MTQPPEFDPNQPQQPGQYPAYGQQVPQQGANPAQYNQQGQAQYGQPQFAQQFAQPGYQHPYLQPPTPRLAGVGLMVAIASIVAAALVFVAGALPWYNIGDLTYSGYDTPVRDSSPGLGAAVWASVIVITGILAVTLRRRGMAIGHGVVTIVIGAILALFPIREMSDLADLDSLGAEASAGFGLILLLIVGIALVILGIMQLVFLPKRPKF